MRTTVDLDPHLLKRLREEAQRQGIPLKELLTAVLRRGLDAPRPRGRYRCPAFSLGRPATPYRLEKALGVAAMLEDEESVRKLALRK